MDSNRGQAQPPRSSHRSRTRMKGAGQAAWNSGGTSPPRAVATYRVQHDTRGRASPPRRPRGRGGGLPEEAVRRPNPPGGRGAGPGGPLRGRRSSHHRGGADDHPGGAGGAAVGPGGNAVGGRSSVGTATGPRGTAAGVSRSGTAVGPGGAASGSYRGGVAIGPQDAAAGGSRGAGRGGARRHGGRRFPGSAWRPVRTGPTTPPRWTLRVPMSAGGSPIRLTRVPGLLPARARGSERSEVWRRKPEDSPRNNPVEAAIAW